MSISAGDIISSTVRKLTGVWFEENNIEKAAELIKDCRKIMNTVNKVFLYIFCCVWIELLFVFLAVILKLNYPLMPVELLWINIVTIPVCSLAVAVQYSEENSSYMEISMPAKGSPLKSLESILILVPLFAIYMYFIMAHFNSISNFMNFSVLDISTIILAAVFSDNVFYKNKITNFILSCNVLLQIFVLFIAAGLLSASMLVLYSVWYKIVFMALVEFAVLTLVKLYKRI